MENAAINRKLLAIINENTESFTDNNLPYDDFENLNMFIKSDLIGLKLQ